MVDKCPSCEREFKYLEDYPLIYVASFERGSIPSDLEFSSKDYTVFAGPISELCNDRPPAGVLKFFKDNVQAKEFKYNHWKWTLDGEWDNGRYRREIPDQREIIVAGLNPYLDSLDGLVGREVPTSELLPQFPREPSFNHAFCIPDTTYLLLFHEGGRTPAGLRVAALQLIDSHLDGSVLPEIHILAKVGHLEYEGRVRK